MCRKDVVGLNYKERSDVKSWRIPVAHDSRISNGNRTEWGPIRYVIIRLIRELKQRRRRWNENVEKVIGLE